MKTRMTPRKIVELLIERQMKLRRQCWHYDCLYARISDDGILEVKKVDRPLNSSEGYYWDILPVQELFLGGWEIVE
jgi:hypothetical protein